MAGKKISEKIESLEIKIVKLEEKVNYVIKLLEKQNGKIAEHEARLIEVEKNLNSFKALDLQDRLREYDKVRWAIITILGLAGVIFAIIKLFLE